MLYEAERGDISIAVVGDAMLSRRMQAFREPHFLKLVELIREGWRKRALAAEHRVEQLEIENHQLKRALTPAPEPTCIDNTHFF